MIVVAIHGGMGTGKTTLADRITKRYMGVGAAVERVSFADALRAVLAIFGHAGAKSDPAPIAPDTLTYAQALQAVGEGMRQWIDEDVWVRYALKTLEMFDNEGADVVIIDDLRYLNEWRGLLDFTRRNDMQFMVKLCERVYVDRGYEDGRNHNHPSECGIDAELFRRECSREKFSNGVRTFLFYE